MYRTNCMVVEQSKLKAFVNKELNATQKIYFVSERLEILWEKEKKVGYKNVLLSNVFKSLLFQFVKI